jgi:hypothetical protein
MDATKWQAGNRARIDHLVPDHGEVYPKFSLNRGFSAESNIKTPLLFSDPALLFGFSLAPALSVIGEHCSKRLSLFESCE